MPLTPSSVQVSDLTETLRIARRQPRRQLLPAAGRERCAWGRRCRRCPRPPGLGPEAQPGRRRTDSADRLATAIAEAFEQAPCLQSRAATLPEKVRRHRVARERGSVDKRNAVAAPRQQHRKRRSSAAGPDNYRVVHATSMRGPPRTEPHHGGGASSTHGLADGQGLDVGPMASAIPAPIAAVERLVQRPDPLDVLLVRTNSLLQKRNGTVSSLTDLLRESVSGREPQTGHGSTGNRVRVTPGASRAHGGFRTSSARARISAWPSDERPAECKQPEVEQRRRASRPQVLGMA